MIASTAGGRIGWSTAGRILLSLAAALPAVPASAATYSVPGFSDTAVVQGLSSPTDFTVLSDGRILVLEKAGRILVSGPGGGPTTVAIDMTADVDDALEMGLLGICLHPGFAANGYVFVYYTYDPPGMMLPSRNRISRFTLTGSSINPASEVVVLDNISAASGFHNGGTILIGTDGKLWAAPGESGQSNPDLTSKAQTLSPYPYEGAFSGKVLRMELDGSPAAGNPFLGDATKEPRIWAYGFRNPFRFSFRPSNGSIFIGDVGQDTLEELDVGIAGGNFGWPYLEGTFILTEPCPAGTTCIPPVFEYGRAVGWTITGGVFVAGNAYPNFLQGKYVFGDWGQGWIRYLEFDSNDAVVGGLQSLASSAEGPVAFHQGPDGHLYYATYGTGRIYRIDYGNFHTVMPCRVLDTRETAGPFGGPRLAAGADRTFVVANRCEIPITARAVSVNLSVIAATDPGHLTVFPAGGVAPNTSAINFQAGQTRANNGILTLGPGGDIVVRCGMAAGGVDFVLDVNGYFE
jgi:glucose/arabinose dehydrogenase